MLMGLLPSFTVDYFPLQNEGLMFLSSAFIAKIVLQTNFLCFMLTLLYPGLFKKTAKRGEYRILIFEELTFLQLHYFLCVFLNFFGHFN